MRTTVYIFLLSFFTRCSVAPVQATGSGSMMLLLVGLLLGAVVAFLIFRLLRKNSGPVVKESSHTVVESMRRVFKVVFAEGHFNELYSYGETKRLFGFLPTTRKALVIIQAKVMVGYDIGKCEWEANEETQTLRLLRFPAPEILSIEPHYKYYDFEENIFNMMGGGDLNKIQTNGRKQVEQAALSSHLPTIAADQMRLVLNEVVHSKHWNLEGLDKISAALSSSARLTQQKE